MTARSGVAKNLREAIGGDSATASRAQLPAVIVPAAGDGTRVRDVAFSKPKPLIPVCGKPGISWIVETLLGQGYEDFVFVVPNRVRDDPIVLYIEDVYDGLLRSQYVSQPQKLGPLHAIKLALPKVRSQGVLIVLSDTICFDHYLELGFDHSWILASPVQDHERWCLVEATPEGFVSGFYDKPDAKPPTNLALIGVYYFHDAAAFRAAADLVIKRRLKHKNEYQISAAIEEYAKHYPVEVLRSQQWHDVGSIENLRRAMDNLMTKRCRAFNRLKLSIRDGIITKSTQYGFGTKTLGEEIKYYEDLPRECAGYLPRIIDYNAAEEDTSLVLEYWPLDNLADTFVYARYSKFLWGQVILSIATLLGRFRGVKVGGELSANTQSMLWEKTTSRITDLESTGFPLANAREVVVNGRALRGWPALADDIQSLIVEVSERSIPAAIHGDFCFSNILSDVHTGLVKCIDPRGEFGGRRGIAGDQRYDIAKLRHSYHGFYDFILNRLYRLVKLRSEEYALEIFARLYHKDIGKVFDRQLIEDEGILLRDIELIEGLLFVSMCSLHYEDPHRQVALWIRGLQILNDCAER